MNTKSPPDAATRQNADPVGAGEKPGSAASASEAFRDAAFRIGEIREYVAYYIAVQTDAIKLAIRNGLFYAVLGVVGLLAAGSAVVVAVTLLLMGIANGLGEAMGNRFWLGDLIVGIVVLGAIAIAARMGISMVMGTSRKKTVEKYESRKRDQQTRFGHDVNDRAKP